METMNVDPRVITANHEEYLRIIKSILGAILRKRFRGFAKLKKSQKNLDRTHKSKLFLETHH